MTHSENAITALEHVQAVRATAALIAELYDSPNTPTRARKVAEACRLERLGLQLAKVHAELATAEQVCRVADSLDQLVTQVQLPDSYTAELLRREYLGTAAGARS